MSSNQAVDLGESKQSDLRTLLIAMTIVPTVIVIVRAWSRALLPVSPLSKIPTRFWWDDWAAFAAAAINVVVCGLGLKLVDYGLGLHIEALPPEAIEPFLKLLWIIYYIFDTGTAVSKASALFFYARIFSVSNSRFRYALWLVHALNAAWLLAILLSVTFMCNPIQKAWKTELPGTCLNTGNLWTGSGVTSLVIDVIILLMPLPMLWRLQLKTIRRIQICGVFICGYLRVAPLPSCHVLLADMMCSVVVISIGRVVTIIQAGDEIQLDPTYKISTPVLWLGSEIAISTISVSIPSCFFLVQRVRSKGWGSLFSARMNTSRSGNTGTHNLFHDEEDHTLVSRAHDYPYLTRTKATAEFGGVNQGTESPGHSGIHVMHSIEVCHKP